MNADSRIVRGIDDDHVGLIVEVFRMLADATRVQVLWALVDRELSVNELAEFVGKPAPSVSQHLAKLRMARPAVPAGRAPRSTTASRTSTSANWSATRCSTPNTPGPVFPPTIAARSPLLTPRKTRR